MRFRATLLATALLAAPLAAQAQPFHGVYIGAGAGYNLPENDPLATGGDIEPGGGVVGLGSIGYGLGNGFRFELEGNFRQAPLPSESNAVLTGNGGHLDTYGVMANAFYDLDIGLPWLYPYVGGGVGYAWSNFSRNRTFAAAEFPLLSQHIDGTDGAFAFQAIGGLSFPIPNMPGLSVTAEYRFFGIPGSETFDGSNTVSGTPGAVPIAPKVQHQYNHSFLIGVRYAFGQVPPPSPAVAPAAAPAPAMQPARSYLVFFDWDKATLTERARQIIKEAADNSTHVKVTRIGVNGYTDTSGTPQYNMGLSIRRATSVKAELVRDGVPASDIVTQGFGETHLLVPTGAGVREPQNRRVEIILH
ncbi:MAG TPA: OmpA family protein [Acetobacteraceae bacterium]|jgi:outer membrane protein OmpA-like peptidoglycan-associated protein